MCIEHGTGQVEGVHSFYEGEISKELGYVDPMVQPSEEGSRDTKSTKQLNLRTKARINVPIALHPPQFTAAAQELVHIAHQQCSSIPVLDNPNTCRINYYTKRGRIGWHFDRVPSLSLEEQKTVTDPVISMSFGDSAEFQYRYNMSDPANSIILESGDVVIFGGPSRMIYHTVPRVLSNTAPKGLNLHQFAGRFNVSYYYN